MSGAGDVDQLFVYIIEFHISILRHSLKLPVFSNKHKQFSYRAMTTLWNKTRPFIMTRASFAGTGKYSFKWLGDNQSQWRQIPWSIIGKYIYI